MNPNQLNEIQNFISNYSGILKSIIEKLTVQEIISFQDFITRTIDEEEKICELENIYSYLKKDYSTNLDSLDPRIIFQLSAKRDIQSHKLVRLPIDEVAEALWSKNRILEAFNHPLRTKIRDLYEGSVKDRSKNYRQDLFPPLGKLNIIDNLEDGILRTFEEYVVNMKSGNRVSRRLALAIGVYTTLGGNQVGLPFGSETMHTVIGNPLALADLLRCHAIASAPRNGKFAEPSKQADLLMQTIAILQETELLRDRTDADTILRQWTRNMGIVVEADPYKACKRIEHVLKHLSHTYPINHVRIYMVEGGDEMIDTIKVIKSEFPDLNIHVGQVVTLRQALEIEDYSVASIGIGIASGSRCSTGARSGVPSQNINFLYALRKNYITTPIFVETGVPIQALPVALASGVRRINYTAGILGFLSATGHWYALEDEKGVLMHPYDGEASAEAKSQENRLYSWNMPMFIEGANGWHIYNDEQRHYPTIPHKLWYLTETCVLTSTFHKHVFHEDLINDKDISFSRMSERMVHQVLPYQVN